MAAVDATDRAYQVWMCGSCTLELYETDTGLQCETCGRTYDYFGCLVGDNDE